MRNRKPIPVFILAAAMWLGCQPAFTQAEPGTPSSESKAEKSPAPAMSSERGKPIQPFRLDFSLNELDGGKKINSRHYSMDLTAGNQNQVKIGTRVPVETGRSEGPAANSPFNSQWQYMDVGTTIWAHLKESKDDSDDLQLEVQSDVSDIDKGTQSNLGPIVRQMKFNGTTLLVTGRPIVIATMDDPNSTRQFQLEVTVTKLR